MQGYRVNGRPGSATKEPLGGDQDPLNPDGASDPLELASDPVRHFSSTAVLSSAEYFLSIRVCTSVLSSSYCRIKTADQSHLRQ